MVLLSRAVTNGNRAAPRRDCSTWPGAVAPIFVIHFTDPGCPWAYSTSPAQHVLRWRYGDQLRWRTVLIGLTEAPGEYERRGYTPAGMARGYRRFRRFGMPFDVNPRAEVVSTGRACRAIVAARHWRAGADEPALRALQLAWFTTALLLDHPEAIATALSADDALDPPAILALVDDPAVEAAYQRDRAEARTAVYSPSSLQGKTAATDGPERYTAPTLRFERDGTRLEAGGFQPLEAYDALVANLDPSLDRRPPPADPMPLLERFTGGLTTQEVAALLAESNDAPDAPAAEDALIPLVAAGRATRTALGDDALWRAA